VVATVVAAFVADPAFRFFFPDDATYGQLAASFAGWLFDKRVSQGTVWVINDGAAVAMWDAPSNENQRGTSPALELPPDALQRLASYDAGVHGVLPSTSHWYLGVLATHPDQAGQRWGRAAMAEGLRQAAAAGIPAYLETSSQRNVAIYQRAGWQTVSSVPLGSLEIRVMRHSG
jgi:GNAT superfamily N-acetyltransferase